MNIKEVEVRTGLERANIYFYEKEGLITPIRLENGYRDYSESDLDVLKRIILLRSLHISIDDIRRLRDGKLSLNDAMDCQMRELAKEEEKANYARRLCEGIREENISYYELNADKYLAGIPVIPKKEENPYFYMPSDGYLQTLFPYRRFLARMFDLFFYYVLVRLLFGLVFSISIMNPNVVQNVLIIVSETAALLLLEPTFLHFFGTTPGKRIWGLTIKAPDGKNLSFSDAYHRTWGVLFMGFALYIPIVREVCLYKCLQRCKDHRLQDWEVELPTHYTAKENHTARPIISIAAAVLLFAGMIAAALTQILPPNRGDLTIKEFSENFNFYSNYYQYSHSHAKFMTDGQWHGGEEQTNKHYPTYHYVIDENGHVTEVSFFLESKDEDFYIDYPVQHIIPIALALIYSNPEESAFSGISEEVIEKIADHYFQDFSLTIGPVTMKSDCEYEGFYQSTNTTYWKYMDAEDATMKISFTCTMN